MSTSETVATDAFQSAVKVHMGREVLFSRVIENLERHLMIAVAS